MTIKICVIEDETIFQEQIKKIVELYEAKNSFPIEAEYYSSSTPRLIQHACDFHLFILDIQLNNENGIAIAKQLRTAGYKGSIVFLTSYCHASNYSSHLRQIYRRLNSPLLSYRLS